MKHLKDHETPKGPNNSDGSTTTHSQIDESKIAEIKRQRTQAWKAHKDRVEAEQNRVIKSV
ncbi:hypothetical protein HYE37_03835 [Mycoplasmopsis bovis]|nr:hypothetical protein [Mycoplasmopsis bovis]QQH21403.1 hypothetical protein HYE37_03835 [Mycoplasmopsis bovis]